MSTKQQTHEDVVKKTSFFHKFSKHRLAMLGLLPSIRLRLLNMSLAQMHWAVICWRGSAAVDRSPCWSDFLLL